MNNFDTSKYRLGSLCKRGHDWNNTGQSLRTNHYRTKSCVECFRITQEKWQSAKKSIKPDIPAPSCSIDSLPKVDIEILKLVDTTKYFLGSLCKRNHDWSESGRSLRLIKKGRCVACRNFHSAKFLKDRRLQGLSQDILIKAADLFWSKVDQTSESGC